MPRLRLKPKGLALTREVEESICIGDDIIITVVGIKGDRVRLAVDAPRDMQVDRLEIRHAKERDAAAAQRGNDAG